MSTNHTVNEKICVQFFTVIKSIPTLVIKATLSAIGNTYKTWSTCLYNFLPAPVYENIKFSFVDFKGISHNSVKT